MTLLLLTTSLLSTGDPLLLMTLLTGVSLLIDTPSLDDELCSQTLLLLLIGVSLLQITGDPLLLIGVSLLIDTPSLDEL